MSTFGSWFKNKFNARYIVWSVEKGASGTKHIQGYFELEKCSKFTAMKNKVRTFGGWIAPAKGTALQSEEYISHTGKWIGKQGLIAGPWSEGTIKQQGCRTDITTLASDIKQGHSLKKLAVNHTETMLKYFSNAQKLQSLLNTKKRDWMTELYVYTGIAGTGKSYTAHEEAKKYLEEIGSDEEPYDLMVPAKKGDPLWFQNYEGESVVIIDDFYGNIDIDTFKRMIDR